MSLFTKTFPILLCPYRMKADASCRKNRTLKHCSLCGATITCSDYRSNFIVKPLLCNVCEKKGGAQ
jgi:hypothetical protein